MTWRAAGSAPWPSSCPATASTTPASSSPPGRCPPSAADGVLPVAGRQPPEFDVIILAGGRGARLGGADKPGLVVGSATMAATAARAAAAAGARQIILVGPDRPDVTAVTGAGAGRAGGLIVTREDPPGAG